MDRMKKTYLSPQAEILELSSEAIALDGVSLYGNILSGGNVDRDDEGWSDWE